MFPRETEAGIPKIRYGRGSGGNKARLRLAGHSTRRRRHGTMLPHGPSLSIPRLGTVATDRITDGCGVARGVAQMEGVDVLEKLYALRDHLDQLTPDDAGFISEMETLNQSGAVDEPPPNIANRGHGDAGRTAQTA